MSSADSTVKLTTTAVAWRDRIFDWQASGLSQTEYCSRNKININQFWNWKSKFNQAGITKKDRSKHLADPFIAVTVTDCDTAASTRTTASDGSGVVVVVNRGIEIHLDRGFDAAVLVATIKALGGI